MSSFHTFHPLCVSALSGSNYKTMRLVFFFVSDGWRRAPAPR